MIEKFVVEPPQGGISQSRKGKYCILNDRGEDQGLEVLIKLAGPGLDPGEETTRSTKPYGYGLLKAGDTLEGYIQFEVSDVVVVKEAAQVDCTLEVKWDNGVIERQTAHTRVDYSFG